MADHVLNDISFAPTMSESWNPVLTVLTELRVLTWVKIYIYIFFLQKYFTAASAAFYQINTDP